MESRMVIGMTSSGEEIYKPLKEDDMAIEYPESTMVYNSYLRPEDLKRVESLSQVPILGSVEAVGCLKTESVLNPIYFVDGKWRKPHDLISEGELPRAVHACVDRLRALADKIEDLAPRDIRDI